MSSGAELPASFRPQGPGTIEDPDKQNPNQLTQSTILYLLQEATMLAPPAHGSCFDSKSSPRPGEGPKQDSRSHTPPLQPRSPRKCTDDLSKNDAVQFMSVYSKSTQSSARCSSPWEVMSLINLQCERLLHSSEPEENGSSISASSSSVSDAVESSMVNVSGSVGVVYSAPNMERDDGAGIRSRKERGGIWEGCLSSIVASGAEEKWCTTKNSDSAVESQTFNVGFRYKISSDCGDSAVPINLSIKRENDEEGRAPVENEASTEPRSRSVLSHCSSAADDVPRSSPSVDYLASSSGLTLDFNSNLCVTFDPQKDTHPPLSSPPTPSLILSGETGCAADSTLSQKGGIATTKAELEQSPSCEADQVHSAPNQTPPSVSQWRTKTPRKQPRPTRSIDARGGDVQGVTFRMRTKLDDSKEHCRLLITSKYSDKLSKNLRKIRVRSRSSQSSLRTSSSDEESDPTTSLHKNKICASCCTMKTPLWRDAEDGTPLCNACGIRYKKYRVRCPQCWHIPRKEGNSNMRCFKCGDLLRLAPSHRKHTAW